MNSDSEEDHVTAFLGGSPEVPADAPENKRGRPAGKSDSTKRFRRTAQEISDDKIRIVQMRLDALRETEERKLVNKKSRPSRAKAVVEEAAIAKAPKKEVIRDESPPSPKRLPLGSRRQALYDSWFTSGPRTRY